MLYFLYIIFCTYADYIQYLQNNIVYISAYSWKSNVSLKLLINMEQDSFQMASSWKNPI